MSFKKLFIPLLLLFLIPANAQIPGPGNILYVDANVSGGNNSGNSWANALPELADALKYAKQQDNYTAGDPLKIYVAIGTYKPKYSPADNNFGNPAGRDNSFLMVNNVQLYGGFDPSNNITELAHARILPTSGSAGTVLSGDVNGDDVVTGSGSTLAITNNSENNYQVVVIIGNVGTALLDGFSITGGNASITATLTTNGINFDRHYSVGMLNWTSSQTVANVILSGNSARYNGGGMYNRDSSYPTLTNVTLSRNIAGYNGGGMNNFNSSPTLINVTLSGNTTTYDGGGLYNKDSSPTITNVTLNGNAAGNSGGGMYNDYSSPTLTNVALIGNTANFYGGGIFNFYSSPTLTNVALIGNTANYNGGGMFNDYGSSPTLANGIVWGNTSASSPGIYNIVNAPVITYSLVQGVDNTANGGLD